jgi:hypothetical protein
MVTDSVQSASHEGETHWLSANLRQSRIHHAHGQAEHRNFGIGIPQAMQFKTGNNRKQGGNCSEHQAMGMTQSRLTQEGSRETTRVSGSLCRAGIVGRVHLRIVEVFSRNPSSFKIRTRVDDAAALPNLQNTRNLENAFAVNDLARRPSS